MANEMTQTIRLHQNRQWVSQERVLSALEIPVRSLYVHIPFCFHKCHYCDFYSFVDNQDRQEAFTRALVIELTTLAGHAAKQGKKPSLSTIFVGGGTPTLLRPELWEMLLEALHALFSIDKNAEFTVESNPETTTREVLEVLASGGVNRVSVGAQSFNAEHLKTLERHHDPANVVRALELAAECGIPRRSIDLIFAIPGQTLQDWHRDLDAALELSGLIEHISAYNLMYEPNTAITKRLAMGQLTAVDEETEIAMYRACHDRLAEHGFESYEISNYAKPDGECAHNLAYWRQEQWFAVGPSASAHVAGWRWKNIPHLGDWMASVRASGGYPHVRDVEPPDAQRALGEAFMTGIRLTRGLDASGLLARSEALGLREAVEDAASSLESDGILCIDQQVYRLTNDGLLLADEAGSRFLSALSAE